MLHFQHLVIHWICRKRHSGKSGYLLKISCICLVYVDVINQLPNEMWEKILRFVIGTRDVIAYKNLRAVCSRFREILKHIPQPQPKLYLDPCICFQSNITPLAQENVISFSKLIDTAGMNSGIVLELNAMFNGCLWTDAVLVISHLGFNWFWILDILHLQPSVNSNACEFYVQPTKEFKKNNCL